jgi:membrane-associated phospholipid phosphatase
MRALWVRCLVGAACCFLPSWAFAGAEAESAQAHPAAATAVPSRGDESQLTWRPEWRRFGWTNVAVLGASGAAIGAAFIVGPDRDSPSQWRWSVDEKVRSAVRADSSQMRHLAREGSDLSLGLNLAYAYLGDALIVATWQRRSPDVGLQLALINTQVLAVATAVQLWTANLASRERPYGRLCDTGDISPESSDCTSDYRYRSFYSGHTSTSFALAAATCTHHSYVPFFGGRNEWVPCAAGLTLAALTGAARMVADQHYVTDVIVGAAAGSAIGWLIPWLHYETGVGEDLGRGTGSALQVAVAPTPRGISVTGTF